jgi:tetratricopeptide (TPR) repeat protein
VTETWYRNGNAHYEKSEFEEALDIYDRILNMASPPYKVLYRKAMTLFKLGRQQEAADVIRLAIESEPYEIGGYVKGNYDSPEGRKRAIEEFDRRLSVFPGYTGLRYLKGLAHANQEEYEIAIDCCDKILALEPEFRYIHSPTFTKAWRLKGSCYYLLHKHTDAEKCFERLATLEDLPVWIEQASYFGSEREFEKALELINKVLRLEPENPRALEDKATYLARLGRSEEARKYYDKYEEIESTNPGFWLSRGIALATNGLSEKAIPFLDKAIALGYKFGDAWYHKGRCLADMGQHAEAIQCYDEAVKRSPKYFAIWHDKGLSHLAVGQHELAIRCFDQVLAGEPGHKSALEHKALALRILNERRASEQK